MLNLSTTMLRSISQQIDRGNAINAILCLNEYDGVSPGLRHALIAKAKLQLTRNNTQPSSSVLEKLGGGAKLAELTDADQSAVKQMMKTFPIARSARAVPEAIPTPRLRTGMNRRGATRCREELRVKNAYQSAMPRVTLSSSIRS